MSWPTPQDYNEALQSPHISFADAQLRDGQVVLDQLGLPRPISGAFASVYKVRSKDGKDWAVRCFLHSIQDQHTRYSAISNFICNDKLDFTTPFQFLEKGVSIKNRWIPLLKMQWIEGLPLDIYVRQNILDQSKIQWLAAEFSKMLASMSAEGIAHGDLQHGNILVTASGLTLVDYDGMYVPLLKGLQSNELGHRNYQHPARSREDFSPTLDNFAAHVILNSLKIIAFAPEQLEMENEGLIFSREDFLEPEESETFHTLESHSDSRVVDAARTVRSLLKLNHMALPKLDEEFVMPEVPPLKPPKKKRERPEKKLPQIKADGEESALFEKTRDWYTSSPPATQSQSQSSPFQMRLGSEFGYTHLNREWEDLKGLCFRTTANEITVVGGCLALSAPFLFLLLLPFDSAGKLIVAISFAYAFYLSSLIWQLVRSGADRAHVTREALTKASDRLKQANPVKVLYYVIDRSLTGSPGGVQITTYWLPPTLRRLLPICNWSKLSKVERQGLNYGRNGAVSGDLYYYADTNEPLVLVTNEGLVLWLTDFGRGPLVSSWFNNLFVSSS